ncbi:hypothetical protein MHH81_09235 [Psychrobacillus sp. FSL H8-0484]|uniref:hypothetical protein n=1 Tax=Psychrobacillus sp. FSL H8-0484 TaxID=2921390 RepID=UPI0030F5A634
MKKLLLVLVISLGLISLAACSEKGKVFTFQGEGENWRASYEITDSNFSYTIFYIGKEKVPEMIDYNISHNYRGRNLEVKNYPINEDGLIQSTTPDNNGDQLLQVDESITVTISWDGKEEELILPRK